MIKLATADLNYLLQQVNIGNNYLQLGSPLDPLGVREVDGGNNNLVGGFDVNGVWVGGNIHPTWGQSDTDFPRMFFTDNPETGVPSYGVTYGNQTLMAMADAAGNQPIVNGALNPDWTPTFNPMSNVVMTAAGASPRTITQLISSSDIDPTSATYNPAAAAAMEALAGQPVDVSNTVVGSTETAKMPDSGVLGGVPFNEFNVAFGQFFDHGLDFISKNGGYVLIKLSPSDPLYDANANPANPFANTMMLSRAKLTNPNSDFEVVNGNVVLKDGVMPSFNNNTGLLIDQSQTYGSHVSVNVLVRQYDETGHATGKLITGAEDGNGSTHDLGTWTDMVVNAARLGIGLGDLDVLDAPSIRATATGAILFDPLHMTYNNGTADVPALFQSNETIAEMAARTGIDAAILAAHDPFYRDDAGHVLYSNQPILSDIAHGSSPVNDFGQPLTAIESGPSGDPTVVPGAGQYNAAALARHYVSGDSRANENVGLTAVHHIFHEEHNIEVDAIKVAAIRDALARGTLDYLNGYTDADGKHWDGYLDSAADPALLSGLTAASTDAEVLAVADTLTWDTEYLYQAARIITESEYNHIAIDQYVGGLVALPEFVSYSGDVNMSVTLEFSQAVFRLGHSQLNEMMQIAVEDVNHLTPGQAGYVPTYTEVGLFDAFLNPALYDATGASAIALGLLNQQANQVDEFVTSALQQTLVGVGLDLPALNIARGRDVGLPTLNELRQQIFDGVAQNTSNAVSASLAPYTSWEDFGGHLRTPESLVNFIAAYGRDNATFHLGDLRVAYEAATDVSDPANALHAYDLDGDGVIGLQDMRANAQAIVDAAANETDPLHQSALTFMRGQGAPVYVPGANGEAGHWDVNAANGGDQGFWDVDLWIGGLAEQPLFDGPLGTTFTMVMADFGQKMQDGDRFYYLYRMPVGHHLGDQIIGEQFADLIMRTTGLEHIGDAFGYPSATYILDGLSHNNEYDDASDAVTGYGVNDYFNAIYENLPSSVRAFVIANRGFEAQSLASDGAGPVQEDAARGNYTYGAPAGWSLTGTGGTFAPATSVISADGHGGGNVGWTNPGATLSQDTGQAVVEGDKYTVTVNLGNRQDMAATFGATLMLVDSVGTVIATRAVTAADVPDGEWRPITFGGQAPTGVIGTVSVRIVNTGSEQVLVDDVHVDATEAGGSANDGHLVVGGLEGDDYVVGALGDDYLYGDAGNDVLEGAQGNDHLYGGDGDDWITDYENDDFAHGGAGNDYINLGPGVLDTAHGGEGDDDVHGGDGVDEVYGDDGNDRLYGDGDTDLIMGGEGSDYMDGGDSVDEMFGGNGNDWMRGGVGDDNINGGSGNDLMEGGLGPTANDGDRLNGDTAPGALPVIEFNGDGTEGDMDIASYEDVEFKITASLQDANANGTSSNLLDTYSLVEGVVGSAQDDTLTGADANGTAGNGVDNYLVGGGGNDTLAGLGDDAGANGAGSMDFIFADEVIVDNDLYWIGDDRHAATGHGNEVSRIENWYDTGETRVVFEDGTLGHILGDHGAEGANDVAVYRGNHADYTIQQITMNGQDAIKITDNRQATDTNGNPIDTDGMDILVGVETARFADGDYSLVNTPPTDIVWNAMPPSGRPDFGETLATLSVVDPDSTSWTYSVTSAVDPQVLNVAADGTVTVAAGMTEGQNRTNTITAADGNGAMYSEDFHLQVADGASNTINGLSISDIIWARGGNDTVNGGEGDDVVYGQGGNDTLNGDAGNDTFHWNVGNGRDRINGGANGTAGDTFVVNGDNSAETFGVYTRDDWLAVAGNAAGSLDTATEIVVTRNGTGAGAILAELQDVEELVINTGGGADTVIASGNFDPTRLAYNTIHINGGDGDDTVDISQLTSDHRIVFHGAGGTNHVIGNIRPQDVLDNATMMDVSAAGNGDDAEDDGADGSGGSSADGSAGGTPVVSEHAHAGTGDGDVLVGDGGADVLSGLGGDDVILGNGGGDTLLGGSGDDLVRGGEGRDVVMGGADDDVLFGGADADLMFGDAGDDRIFADAGYDAVEGGSGDDTVYLGFGDDRVIATVGDGDDVYWGEAGSDTLDYSAITANLTVDLGNGLLQHGGVSSGQSGTDAIFGFENVVAGTGNDTIVASSAVNVMDGGQGQDSFVFGSAVDADGDTIAGFQPGDRIDLSGIDADEATAGQQSFVLFAGSAFTAVGQVIVTSETRPDGEHTIVKGHVSADGSSDFTLDLTGHHALTASDFQLN